MDRDWDSTCAVVPFVLTDDRDYPIYLLPLLTSAISSASYQLYSGPDHASFVDGYSIYHPPDMENPFRFLALNLLPHNRTQISYLGHPPPPPHLRSRSTTLPSWNFSEYQLPATSTFLPPQTVHRILPQRNVDAHAPIAPIPTPPNIES